MSRTHKVPENSTNLSGLDQTELLALFPIDRMEEILGGGIEWSIFRTQPELLGWGTLKYNTCVTTDAHRRFKGMPPDKHPLHRYSCVYDLRTG